MIRDPGLCVDCGHDVELHRSTGCLWGLGRCACQHDMRGNTPRRSRPGRSNLQH